MEEGTVFKSKARLSSAPVIGGFATPIIPKKRVDQHVLEKHSGMEEEFSFYKKHLKFRIVLKIRLIFQTNFCPNFSGNNWSTWLLLSFECMYISI